MHNLHCNVIQDLLPLYADDVVSEESRKLVEHHLECCPECRQTLGEIQTSIPIPQHTDDTALKIIKKKQQFRGLRIALIAALCVALLLAYPIYLIHANSIEELGAEYGPECFIVTEYPGGKVELNLTEDAQGAYIYYLYEINEDNTTDLYLYIYGRDPIPRWARRILMPRYLFSPDYPIFGIGPKYNFDSDNYFEFYGDVGGLSLDSTISRVYYQTISSQEQWEFYSQYLISGYLSGYDAPEEENCTLIWRRTK